jgi:hypothetical protein
LLIDHLKQTRAHIFPDRIVSSRTISDTIRSKDKPKTIAPSFHFNLPVLFTSGDPDQKPKMITKRYSVVDELDPSTFANLFVVN